MAQQHSPASRADAPGPSGLGPLNPELLAAITAAVTQVLQAAAPTSQVPQTGAAQVQFVPDPVAQRRTDPSPLSDSSKDGQPGTSGDHTVQNTVASVIEKVISPPEQPGSQSKNTFLSEAIPLSNRVAEKVKKQIWSTSLLICPVAPQ